MSDKKNVLVTGVTGQQGSAVAKALLQNGHQVRGLTRNVNSEKALAMGQMGVELVGGDFTDTASLDQALANVDAVYAMTTPFETGMDAETAQGVAMIEAAKRAGTNHFIYSSVSDADMQTGVPHFDSKYEVEKVLAGSGLNYSISAPAYFMDNVLGPWILPSVLEGALGLGMPADRKLQQVAVSNIGDFAAALVERGEQVFGKRYNIAGDELTGNEVVAILSKALGKEVAYQAYPVEAVKSQNEDMGLMFEWFDTTGYSANIEMLKKEFPDVAWKTFESWANDLNWDKL